MQLKDILKECKRQTNYSNEYIAKQVGVTKTTVSRWVSGETTKIKPEAIDQLSALFHLDIRKKLTSEIPLHRKPILGFVKGGYDLFIEENYLGYEEISSSDAQKGDFFLRVQGESMIGAGIMHGSLLYIQKCNDVANNTIAVVVIGNEEVTVKRVIKKPDMLILEAANPSIPSRYFTPDEIQNLPVQILGKVLYCKTNYH